MITFHQLVKNTLATFRALPCEQINLPDNIACIERDEIDGTLVLENQFFRVGECGELRLVHIHAPKIHIITLFFFPQADWQLPVYCMELGVFGAQPIVGILDCFCLQTMNCHDKVQQFMQQARSSHSHLQQATDMPEWMTQCCSGNDFFIRPSDNAQVIELAELHLAVLAQFIQLVQHAERFNANAALQHQQQLQHYKNNHRIHAPGLRLMNRSFGEQWTADYMNHYLFK